MHRALMISELLIGVFTLLDQASNARNARVCKAWTEFALDKTWRKVDQRVFLSLVEAKVSSVLSSDRLYLVSYRFIRGELSTH